MTNSMLPADWLKVSLRSAGSLFGETRGRGEGRQACVQRVDDGVVNRWGWRFGRPDDGRTNGEGFRRQSG